MIDIDYSLMIGYIPYNLSLCDTFQWDRLAETMNTIHDHSYPVANN